MFLSLTVDIYFCILFHLCSLFKKDKREMTKHYRWPIFIRSLTEFNKNYLLTLKLISRRILLSCRYIRDANPHLRNEIYRISTYWKLKIENVQNIAEAKLAGHLKKRFLKHSPKIKWGSGNESLANTSWIPAIKLTAFTEVLKSNIHIRNGPYRRVFNRLHKATQRYPQ